MAEPSTEHVYQLLAAGRQAEAIALLMQQVDAGNADALYMMAVWRLIGSQVPRDLGLARELLARARAKGQIDATMSEISLAANGSGRPACWQAAILLLNEAKKHFAEAQLHHYLLEAMELAANGSPMVTPVGKRLQPGVDVSYFSGFLSIAECKHVAASVIDILTPASVIDPVSGNAIQNPIRTSDAAVIGPTREDLVLRAINLRIAAASATQVEQGEALTVLRYRQGQQFRLHSDAIAGAENQRVATMLLYLNDDFSGGETVFPDLELTIRPRAGDGLLFSNVDSAGKTEPRMRHAGAPVRLGTKWLATRWIRARPFSPWNGPDSPI